jgi:NhaA family Na+:H+ antiporter
MAKPSDPVLTEPLPAAPIERWVRPLVRFLQVEAAGGLVLLVCTVFALVAANSPWSASFDALWKTPFSIRLGSLELSESLGHWINDGLMTIFFFVVGLEIKHELVEGELRNPRKAALPAVAALGGMVVPASIYLLLQKGRPGEAGWGVPMATDIAFVVGFLALLGPRVPLGLKVLLLTLAIVDDIGAVVVIAIAYTGHLSFPALGWAAVGLGLIYLMNRIGVRTAALYVVIGAGVWLAVYQSGVHPTVAGVVLGLMTPVKPWIGKDALCRVMDEVGRRLRERPVEERAGSLGYLGYAAREAVSPLVRLETLLHPWVAFVIMPLFALYNAGVRLNPRDVTDPVALAVTAGLVLGKPIGIVLFSWAAERAGLAQLPSGVNWWVMVGAGCLAGIGFTMSLFIAGLGLRGEQLEAAKVGILMGSGLSAVVGCALLLGFLPKGKQS